MIKLSTLRNDVMSQSDMTGWCLSNCVLIVIRTLWVKAIRAMQIASRIRQIRKERFHRLRLVAQRKLRISLASKEIQKQGDIIRLPVTKLAKDKLLSSSVKRQAKSHSVFNVVTMSDD